MGAWIETYHIVIFHQFNQMSHPTWVRGLKHVYHFFAAIVQVSHPTWVRGLKQIQKFEHHSRILVASYMGAWIETPSNIGIGATSLSHPTWVRGLKHRKVQSQLQDQCRILHGCVD